MAQPKAQNESRRGSGALSPPSAARASAPVLLIEDDLALSGVLARYLGERGHRSTVAASAQEATSVLRAGVRPALVLLDINLPGESGWEFLRSGVLAAGGDPPVVILSAIHISPANLREFGCAGYLPKPFAISTLLEVVERHLGPAAANEEPGVSGALGGQVASRLTGPTDADY